MLGLGKQEAQPKGLAPRQTRPQYIPWSAEKVYGTSKAREAPGGGQTQDAGAGSARACHLPGHRRSPRLGDQVPADRGLCYPLRQYGADLARAPRWRLRRTRWRQRHRELASSRASLPARPARVRTALGHGHVAERRSRGRQVRCLSRHLPECCACWCAVSTGLSTACHPTWHGPPTTLAP